MKSKEIGKLIKIYISEAQKYKSKPLYHLIVERAKKEDILMVTVYRAIEGIGIDKKIHTSHILTMSDDLPLTIELCDSTDKINKFILQLDEVIENGIMIVEKEVELIKYTK